MLDAAMVEFLAGGTGLIVATVGAGGEPHATRGWALTPLSPRAARLLVPADDGDLFGPGVAVAVTAADVRSYRAVQFKGRCRSVEPATDDDLVAAAAHVDGFAAAVRDADGTPRALVDRLVPPAYAACVVEFDALYDQTPGPGAGAALTAAP